MKKLSMAILGLGCVLALASCGEKSTSSGAASKAASSTAASSAAASSAAASSVAQSVASSVAASSSTTAKEEYTIYLAGDSTVKTYSDDQYIGGWGQYLDQFVSDNVTVVNAAEGGRSSRSFINEGRLYDNDSTVSFSQNGGKAIGDTIKEGDYLFIQFAHNDDDTKLVASASSNYGTIYDRMVPLGDATNGTYPVTAGEKTTTTVLPEIYTQYASASEETKALETIAKYGSTYYAYGSGTYKWYMKQYIDFAREKGATPVLVTPVPRVKFSGNEIIGGAGLHGENFAYVQAVRQLAEEEDCLLVDLFADTKEILEAATSTYANYLMALKPNSLTGTWPAGYDSTYGNTDLGYSGIEATHYNKYGAFLSAAKVAEAILADKDTKVNNNTESFEFADSVLTTPENYIAPSNLMSKSTISTVEALFTTVNVTDPERTYPTADALEAKLAEIPAVADITAANYEAVAVLLEEAKVLYAQLNVDDRKAEYKTKIDATEVQIAAIEKSLRPVATNTYTLDCSTLTAVTDVAAPFVVNDAGNKFSINSDCFKFGGSGSTAGENISITVEGTGTVLFTITAYSGNTEKACLLGVSDGTTETKANLDSGSPKEFTFEFTISGSATFYIYRAAGSGTGVMCSSIVTEYFAA
ncbi:MAG: hypothetical protein K6A63_00560 [Acholeplasmatales bacterium]|nr:hypothetical protein [Acholeplasmatales bacterium]